MNRRHEVVAFAAMLPGLGANPADGEARARYLELVAPGESAARAAELSTMSGCALVVRGIWRAFIAHPIMERPYVTGKAMSDLVQIAREAGALHPWPARIPEAGDVIIIGGGADGGGPEHAWIALSVSVDEDAASLAASGIDGGQRDAAGFQVVKEREHVMGQGRDRATDDGAQGGAARRVRYVIDTETVLERFGR